MRPDSTAGDYTGTGQVIPVRFRTPAGTVHRRNQERERRAEEHRLSLLKMVQNRIDCKVEGAHKIIFLSKKFLCI
jgi:hypothetical protein